jgi:hypothetical protein
MSDIFVYKCPDNSRLELRPEDIAAMYLKDANAEMAATDDVEILIRDTNGFRTRPIAQGIYTGFKEFQDRNKTKKIGASYYLKSGEQLAVRAKATTVLVNASCYFQITGRLWS